MFFATKHFTEEICNKSMHNLGQYDWTWKSEVLTAQVEFPVKAVPMAVPTRFQQLSRDIYSSIAYAFLTCDFQNWIKCYILKLYIS